MNIIKKILTSFIFSGLFFSSIPFVSASVYVNGYYRSNGTYVQPHYRSSPDSSPYNNYSYPGNTNPYTGVTATGNPDTYLSNYYNNSSGSSYTYTSPSPSYTTITGGYTMGATVYCNSGYVKKNNACQLAPTNSVSYGSENFWCNTGYYKNGDRCDKAPDNAYVVGSSWSCSYGYTQISGSCIKTDSILANGSWCNNGTVNRNNSCVSTQDASNIDSCVRSFGTNNHPVFKYDGTLQCACNDGYEWNTSRTSCTPKVFTQTASVASSGVTQAELVKQIENLLATITALQKQIANAGAR